MPDAIESVESERCSQDDLCGILDCLRKSRDDLQDMRRVESSRSGKICQKVTVHQNTKADTSDSIGDGREPCQLGLVDGEVRG